MGMMNTFIFIDKKNAFSKNYYPLPPNQQANKKQAKKQTNNNNQPKKYQTEKSTCICSKSICRFGAQDLQASFSNLSKTNRGSRLLFLE